ncbi:MAG: radical SAM protein [Deltaproteobacteria bacterium]|nr:radical SAM protein [Deltaproteobacteria bacterium]
MPHQKISEHEDKIYYRTKSLCPECETLLPAAVFARQGGVFVGRECPHHGYHEGLICSDSGWYDRLPDFNVDPTPPKNLKNKIVNGCPDDCGLCQAHQQIAGTATIEISNECNASCPVCLADNKKTFSLSAKEVHGMIENLLTLQDTVGFVTLSGGEPTIHPELFGILDCLKRPEVGRVAINSNGIRICTDDAFLDRLATYNNIYITLHFDGTQAKLVRGVTHEFQMKALTRLLKWGIPVVPSVVAVKGLNEPELGEMVKNLLIMSPAIRTVMLTMMCYTGSHGSHYQGQSPVKRLTALGAIEAMELTTQGLIKKTDFLPLAFSNPACVTLAYYLVDEGEITALYPLGDMNEVIKQTKNKNLGDLTFELETLFTHIIDHIYAHPKKFADGEKLLQKFKRLMQTLFPDGKTISNAERIRLAEERIKGIYLYQLMDKYNFDTSRLSKCVCQHLLPDNRIIPTCAYYSYYRKKDPRFN